MKCFVCYQAETMSGSTSVLLERGHLSLTINNVPALICPFCGEAYAEEVVTVALLRQAGQIAKAGMKVGICDYEITED
jgi:YgiT-type zinc finger domain-containing protein